MTVVGSFKHSRQVRVMPHLLLKHSRSDATSAPNVDTSKGDDITWSYRINPMGEYQPNAILLS